MSPADQIIDVSEPGDGHLVDFLLAEPIGPDGPKEDGTAPGVGSGSRMRKSPRRSAEGELQAIAAALVIPLNVGTRDVHTWIEAKASERAEWRASAVRREDAIRRLFEHPSTPALAQWLIRYARPSRLEVGLAEAHRVAARIKADRLSPEAGVARLIRTANRSWHKDKAESVELDPDDFPSPEQPARESETLVPEARALLLRAGIEPSERAARMIAEAVDQAVDFLADEADRTGRRGLGVCQPPPARTVNRDRRASSRVASHHASGAILRSLVLGSDGLVARALGERLRAASTTHGVPRGSLTARSWAAAVARLEATIQPQPDSQGIADPPANGSEGHQYGTGVVAASA
jgi:hypothetical protein